MEHFVKVTIYIDTKAAYTMSKKIALPLQKYPATHTPLGSTRPFSGQYLPPGQLVHSLRLPNLEALPNVPFGHFSGLEAPLTQYDPCGHAPPPSSISIGTFVVAFVEQK